jgi:predicted TIM-barrel enzyme
LAYLVLLFSFVRSFIVRFVSSTTALSSPSLSEAQKQANAAIDAILIANDADEPSMEMIEMMNTVAIFVAVALSSSSSSSCVCVCVCVILLVRS